MRWRGAGLVVFATLAGCGGHQAARKVEPPPAASEESAAPAPRAPAQGSRYQLEHDSGPAARPDISKIPEPVPKAEPPSAYGNQSPYTVLGHTYKVLGACAGYSERGIASWYGNKFNGHLTSNRESYDMYQFSAAHRTLPLPCYARVTNLENGRSVVVRVNDRGPFFETRVIDLSYVAAVKLGIDGTGTGLVEVRAIDPGKPEPSAPVAVNQRPGVARKATLYLQAGAFADPDNAKRLAARLEHEGIGPLSSDAIARDGRTLHRVRIGPLASVDEADRLEAQLKRLGVASVTVNVD
jgi:rare lipoprotein A